MTWVLLLSFLVAVTPRLDGEVVLAGFATEAECQMFREGLFGGTDKISVVASGCVPRAAP